MKETGSRVCAIQTKGEGGDKMNTYLTSTQDGSKRAVYAHVTGPHGENK